MDGARLLVTSLQNFAPRIHHCRVPPSLVLETRQPCGRASDDKALIVHRTCTGQQLIMLRPCCHIESTWIHNGLGALRPHEHRQFWEPHVITNSYAHLAPRCIKDSRLRPCSQHIRLLECLLAGYVNVEKMDF